MSPAHLVTITLWVVPLVLQSAIAVAMVRRKLAKAFPVFFCYTVLVPSRDVALFFLRYPGNAYAFVYWWGEVLAVALGVGVIFETLPHIFSSHPYLPTILKSVQIIGLIAAATALLLWVSTPVGQADRGFDWVILLERSARFLQVCMLLVVMIFVSRVGLMWQQYPIGVISGFGVYSAIDLAALEFRGHLHFVTDAAFVLIKPAAYNLACLIWAFYFLKPWPKEQIDQLPDTSLGEWSEAISEAIEQWRRRS